MPEGWSRTFADPIILQDGRKLLTLRDAGEFITRLPKTKHAQPEWRLAAAMLMQAAEDGAPVMPITSSKAGGLIGNRQRRF
jgi:hypothetical protein